MDTAQFDRLAKSLGRVSDGTNRRAIMAGVVVAVTAALAVKEPGLARTNPHAMKRRQRQHRRERQQRNQLDANSTCEDYMRALKCSWEMGGGGYRWNCPRHIKAAGWRMSVCNGSEGITSLKGADLPSADFRGADLTGVNLSFANLTEANLNDTSCSGAHFDHATLFEANFAGAAVGGATFIGAQGTCTYFWGATGFATALAQMAVASTCIFPPDPLAVCLIAGGTPSTCIHEFKVVASCLADCTAGDAYCAVFGC